MRTSQASATAASEIPLNPDRAMSRVASRRIWSRRASGPRRVRGRGATEASAVSVTQANYQPVDGLDGSTVEYDPPSWA